MNNSQLEVEPWTKAHDLAATIVRNGHAVSPFRQSRLSRVHDATLELSTRTSARLSEAERAGFFDVIEPTMHISNQESFFHWTSTELQRIFPHKKLICGFGSFEESSVHVHSVMGCNFSPEYIQTLQKSGGLTRTPIVLKWLSQQQPVLFEPSPDMPIDAANAEWLQNFHRFGLLNIAAHGFSDNINRTASYFSFSAIPGPLTARHANLLKLLVPHLHVTLMRILSTASPKIENDQPKTVSLSNRELEILSWIGGGKTNWEIAQVLRLSESTVKNHIHRILARLNVTTRTQAVAKAISHKLISANTAR
jgi:transcriptional regulator EpsA